ncbi:MAG: hypothetical protein JNK21_13795 [Rhodospirillaceae bacterium]|nr:hypothetical protein [Rhodospirillaceae bacterium]
MTRTFRAYATLLSSLGLSAGITLGLAHSVQAQVAPGTEMIVKTDPTQVSPPGALVRTVNEQTNLPVTEIKQFDTNEVVIGVDQSQVQAMLRERLISIGTHPVMLPVQKLGMNQTAPARFQIKANEINDSKLAAALAPIMTSQANDWTVYQKKIDEFETALSEKAGLPVNVYIDESKQAIIVSPAISKMSSILVENLRKLPNVQAAEPITRAVPGGPQDR